jgi:hypothetical protein
MARGTTENQADLARSPGDEWRGRSALVGRRYSEGLSPGLLFAGLATAGVLGALAWYYLGPDLRRYLKIRNM